MGVMNRRHRCYVCKKEFEYNYITPFRGIETQVKKGVEGKAIAIGVIQGSEGPITEYEIIAECPNCNVLNKIKL